MRLRHLIMIGVGLSVIGLLGKRLFTGLHHSEPGEESVPETRGRVITWARRYDWLVWLVSLGREQAFRQMTAAPAELQPGETVLDVGCGTGTLALVAKERVGETGRVYGIDASAQMIALARRKAARRSLAIDFQVGLIEQLAFPDHSFDVVLSTMMMHHLPDDLKRQGLAEIARVLKPGGRLFVLDFKHPEEHHGRPVRHAPPGAVPRDSGIQDQPALMKEAGFSQVETGETRFPRLPGLPKLGFALGRKSLAGEGRAAL